MRVGGQRESILVWDEEEDEFNVDQESDRVLRERWDERFYARRRMGCASRTSGSSGTSSRGTSTRSVRREQELVQVPGEEERAARKEKPERETWGKGQPSRALPLNPDSAAPNTKMAVIECSARCVVSGNMPDTMRDFAVTEELEELQTLVEEDGDGDDDEDDDTSSVDRRSPAMGKA